MNLIRVYDEYLKGYVISLCENSTKHVEAVFFFFFAVFIWTEVQSDYVQFYAVFFFSPFIRNVLAFDCCPRYIMLLEGKQPEKVTHFIPNDWSNGRRQHVLHRRDFSPNSTDDKIKISSEGHSEELNKSTSRAFLPHQRGNGSVGGGVRDLQQNEKCSVNLNRTQVSGDSEKAAIKLHICQSQYDNKTLPGPGSETLQSSHSGFFFFQQNPELTK